MTKEETPTQKTARIRQETDALNVKLKAAAEFDKSLKLSGDEVKLLVQILNIMAKRIIMAQMVDSELRGEG